MKISYLVTLLALVAVFVGGYLLLEKGHVEQKDTSRIMLYKEYGFITWKNKDDAEYKRVESNEMELPNNVYVKTVEGRGYVILPDNSSIALDVNTEVLISYEGGGTSIMQLLGSTYHRIESLVAGKTYEVRTPNTLATVRGTKLMVTYNEKTKSSKIDVTEHLVEIAKIDGEGIATSSPTAVSEGTTAIISSIAGSGDSTLEIKETASIKEKNAWLEENKAIDEIVNQGGNKRETLKEIIDTLRQVKSDTSATASDRLEAIKQTENPLKSVDATNTKPVVEPKIEEQKKEEKKAPEVKEEIKDDLPAVGKKINEDEFFDKFNTLFVDNFYLDDKDQACNGKSPEEKVRIVTNYAYQSGYPFTSKTLLSFAQAIDTYCKAKDPSTKTRLENRFDEEFPFND